MDNQSNIRTKKNSNLACHLMNHHGSTNSSLKIQIIERINNPIRGGAPFYPTPPFFPSFCPYVSISPTLPFPFFPFSLLFSSFSFLLLPSVPTPLFCLPSSSFILFSFNFLFPFSSFFPYSFPFFQMKELQGRLATPFLIVGHWLSVVCLQQEVLLLAGSKIRNFATD